MMQKAVLVQAGPNRTSGLDELNLALSRGWRVVQMCPMGGSASAYLAALVIIERDETPGFELLEQVQEETMEN